MEVSFDPAKRESIRATRGLDLARGEEVFAGKTLTIEDDRFDYGERRFQTLGMIDGRLVMLVWTARDSVRHLITMWKANEREQESYNIRAESRG